MVYTAKVIIIIIILFTQCIERVTPLAGKISYHVALYNKTLNIYLSRNLWKPVLHLTFWLIIEPKTMSYKEKFLYICWSYLHILYN